MKKHLSPVVAILAILTFFVAAAGRVEASDPPVSILGSWVSGTTHAKEDGNNRALVFIVHAEYANSGVSLNSVTYGGQTMTKVIDQYVAGTSNRAYVAAYILNDAGITAATTTTFTPSWTGTPSTAAYASVFLGDVNQTTLTGATDSATATVATITTAALSNSNGDMAIDAATCSNTGNYSLTNFTEVLEHTMTSADGVDGYVSTTGDNVTPSATHDNVNRQVLIGFVVKARPIRKLTVSASAGGTVTTPGIGDFNYADGNNASIVASANANYHFVNWTGSAVTAGKVPDPNSASTTVLMDANYAVQANFVIDQRMLTVSSSAGGTVTQPGIGPFQYGHGAVVDLNAVPNVGYHFVNWTGDTGTIANMNAAVTTITMNGDYTVQANFAVNQYTVTGTAGANGSIDPTSAVVDYDGSKLFTANADLGYEVNEWSVDGSVVQAGETTYTIEHVTAAHTVNVTFKQSQFTISGTITCAGFALADVNMVGLGVVTDANGFYSATVSSGWSGVVTPAKYGYTFDPNSRSYTNVSSDQTAQDYNALPSDDFDDNRRGRMWRSAVE